MTRFIYDQFSKDYFEELLKPYGKVLIPRRVTAEVRQIDIFFSPTQPNTNIEPLGLLGRFAAAPAIFEPFRNAASPDEICDCILKLLEVKGELRREAKRNKTPLLDSAIPKLWILTPTASVDLLSGLGASGAQDWGSGVYLMPKTLRTAIVVIHQLPRNPETLWLRILGRGKVQSQAIDEFVALPATHRMRKVGLELLYNLQQNLRANQNLEQDDTELIMRLAPLYQQDRELARLEGRKEGQLEGIRLGERQVMENLLKFRFGELSNELQAVIEPLLALPPEEFTPLLMQLSLEELIARFGTQS
jgi:hypothetical protein